MAMSPESYPRFIKNLTELVEEGVVPMSRIDDAVRRILRVKASMGLLDPDRNQLADPAARAYFGTPEHRLVGREAVRKSLVLLKNEGALPLKRDARRLHVAGAAADNLGVQCGGWTIHWQGGDGDITEGTTILAGLREVAQGVNVTHSADGSGAEGADAVIVVVGEKPYAEGVATTSC